MRRYLAAAFFLLVTISAALGGWPRGTSFNSTPPTPTTNTWTFCSTNIGIVAPCTATGTVSTIASTAAVITFVSKWNGLVTPSGPLNDFSSFGHVQLVIQGPASGSLNITGLYIGDAQTTGGGKCSSNTTFCQYDFAGTTGTGARVAVTIGGTTCISPAPANCKFGNVQKTTDSVAFTHDPTKPLLVAYSIDSTSTNTIETPLSTNTSPSGTTTTWFNQYFLSGTAQADVVQKNSGYTNTADRIRGIVKIIGAP